MIPETAIPLSRRAREDLLSIWRRIEQDRSEDVADRVLARIVDACAILTEHPEAGRARPDVDLEARALVVERWLVLYRLVDGSAQIVRVVDGARDLPAIRFQV